MDSPTTWRPPNRFDQYRVIGRLGAGAMGHVYLAYDLALDRRVAIKFVQLGADPRASERFTLEARAAARVQHPNVMAIHALGEVDGTPYLVSEYISGAPLSSLNLPIPWTEALSISVGLARGLAAAHRRGVLHRDIKLANVVREESGEVKLVDFGLAKLVEHSERGRRGSTSGAEDPGAPQPHAGWLVDPALTLDGRLIGTPNYMAPELWRGEQATARTDIYALGIVIFILCHGTPPIAELSVAGLSRAVQSRDAPPLAEVVPAIDGRFAAIVDRCLRRDAGERFSSSDELCTALEHLGLAQRVKDIPEGNPYRGLQAFEGEHRSLFFGRSLDVRTIVDRLRFDAFVVLVGDSGVGKSSVCRAGVLPAIHDGLLDADRVWECVAFTPGRHPLAALTAAVARSLDIDEEALRAQSIADSEAIARALRQGLGDTRGRLLLIDQLEELATLSDPDEALIASKSLVWLASRLPGVRILATVRSDFLTRVAAIGELGDVMSRAVVILRPLSAAGIREAVVGPAELKGVRFESEALVDELVAAGEGGGLPLLQFALAELWEAREPLAHTMTSIDLTTLGGVHGALARHADGVLMGLPSTRRAAVRVIATRLVTVDDTRQSLARAEITAGDPDREAALDALIRGRLIRGRETDSGTVYEIAHEALIRGWGTLYRWLGEDRERREIHHRLELAAREWERLGRPREGLWKPPQVAEAAALDPLDLRASERAFLGEASGVARRQRVLRRLAAAAIPLLFASGYVGVRVRDHLALGERIAAHLAVAQDILADADGRRTTLASARRAALERFDRGERSDGEAGWSEVKRQAAALDGLYARAARELEMAVGVDSSRPEARVRLGEALLEQALLADLINLPAQRDDLVARLALYDPDGALQRRWTAPAVVALTSDPPGADLTVARVERRDDGRRIVGEARALGVTPAEAITLEPGSYILELTASDHLAVRAPLAVTRGEALRLNVALPTPAQVPDGFIYVPAGRFLVGSADESVRASFLTAPPLHQIETGAYLIARHETTFGEWIRFLETLPAEERDRRTPDLAGTPFSKALRLHRDTGGIWTLEFDRSRARQGEPLPFPHRATRAAVDWTRLPAAGLSFADAQAYTRWLADRGAPAGARLCTELEWERAARGADGRTFPHGDSVAPDDANIDTTYPIEARGPDEVGAHPASVSPFGLHDMTGNVWEWTVPVLSHDLAMTRGGAYVFDWLASSSANRSIVDPSLVDPSVGLRVCADWPRGP